MAIPMTPVSGTVSYCDPLTMLKMYDRRVVAEICSDDDNPTDASALPTNPNLLNALQAASGEIEAACMVAGRYQAVDLQALLNQGGNGAAFLQMLCADLAMGRLVNRRQIVDVKVPAAVEEARKLLDRLRTGDKIFGFAEVQAAGIVNNAIELGSQLYSLDLMSGMSRAFGTRSQYLRQVKHSYP
jgi:hypothetical protein